jgi:hypothetical protein
MAAPISAEPPARRGRILARTMRRPVGPSLIATCLASAAILAACGSTEPLPSGAPLPSDRSDVASPSADVTRSGLSDFEARVRDATAREGQLVRDLAAATATLEPAGLRLVIEKMRAWADGERAWLAAHPADPCYDAAATKFQSAIDSIVSSADWFSGMIAASLAPSDDVSRGSMGTEAANDLGDATQALTDAAALAKAARSSCG